MNDFEFGYCGEILAGRLPAPEVTEEPSGVVGVKWSVQEFTEEGRVINGVKGFGEVDRQSSGTVRGFLLVKPHRDHCRQGEKSGCGGMHGPETMLRAVGGQGGRQVWQDQALQHFGGWA